MSKPGDIPDNVIQFPVEAVRRLGFERAKPAQKRPTRVQRMESEGQMNLFAPPSPAQRLGELVPFPHQMSTFEEALLLDDQGDERAEEVYRRAIDNDDRAADAWCNLGVLKSHQGIVDEAFECFANSLTCDVRHAESHYNVGNLYFEMNDLRLARSHYEIAAEIDPDFANAFFNLGLVTALAEDYRTAYAAFCRYRDLVPPEEARIATELLSSIRTVIELS